MVAKERYVQIITKGHQPKTVAEKGGQKPWPAYEHAVEKQLHEMQNHQQRKKGAEMKKKMVSSLFFCH